ncbi:phage portal protein [Intestinibacillus massiliensis]|uniref:phage capsid protein n=1 Tax=Intestinibacillus massiliensis TaxID=1871029 RepID=UPI00117A92F4|nr:phage capsid protein [Intestinibacillus massiliensis]
MIQRFMVWIRQVLTRVLQKLDIKQAVGLDVAVSPEMADEIGLWEKLYRNEPPWKSDTVIPLGLPAAVAGELARLTTLELKTQVSGSARADWLDSQRAPFIAMLQAKVEQGCALGGMAFKPYPAGEGLAIDCTPADRFFPTGFDGTGHVTGGVFVDQFTRGKQYYTRFETHSLGTDGIYTIRNTAYMSNTPASLGVPVPLGSVPAWSELDEEVTLANIKKPLFGYFRVPLANNIDRGSPLGVSVYARAVPLFQQADEQWERLIWEFRASELAVDVSSRAFRIDTNTGRPDIPKGYRRFFRALDIGGDDKPLYNVFSPQIREDPLYKGFQDILRRIEFQCGLAYGTLSDPQTVEKTAEEVKTSKQRSYSTVSSLQAALQVALDDLTYAMDVWATVARLAPAGKYETSYTWDDSIVTDSDKEFAQRMQLCAAGALRPELVIAWYFGLPHETPEDLQSIRERYMPDMEAIVGGGE